MMNILITGGAGFIGSHLAEALVARGDAVTIIDDLSTGSMDNIAPLLGEQRVQFVRDSVRNATTMTELVARCDAIFHLAAAVGVKLIVDRPVHTIETNIHGSEVVLNLANKFSRKVVLASSSEVYGKGVRSPFNEDDDVTFGSTRYSRWSYACSKMIDEFLALAYHKQFGLPAIVCRFFNTIGPRQTGQYGMVVPRFVRRALAGEPIEVYGTGGQSRCFCNVADVVRALVDLLGCEQAPGEVVNVGTDEAITISALADKVIEMTGSTSEKRFISYADAYGQPMEDLLVRVPGLGKIRRLIGFEPKYTLEDSLRQIIACESAPRR